MHSEIEEFTFCDVCSFPEAKNRYGSRAYGKGKDLLIIENLLMISCPTCGTSQLTSLTLKEIDAIKRDRKTLAVTKSVKVASFSV